MLNKIWNWVFRKTKIGQLVDGNKTIIGFAILVLQTLIKLAGEAQNVFPETPWVVVLSQGLKSIDQTIGGYLETLGYGALAVGVTDKAVKDKS